MKPIDLKPFDETDWWAWGGAECPTNGAPLIGEITIHGATEDTQGVVIVDANGVAIQAEDANPIASIKAPFPVGRLVAQQLIADHIYTNEELANMGFTLLR